MLVVVMMFVIGLVVAKPYFASQPRIREQFQRAINGGEAYTRVFFVNKTVEIFAGKMLFGRKKCFEDQITLGGFANTRIPDVVEKYRLFNAELFRSCTQMNASPARGDTTTST